MKALYVFITVCFISSCITVSQAQCSVDRHSTDWKDSWISDTPRPNINPARPDGHYIMYDLGHIYQLGNIHLWNSNVPDSTDRGVQDISIDYSLDGISWIALGDYNVMEATGSAFYEGEDVADFNDTSIRYVLITANSNYGGGTYSFSEIRFDIAGIVVPVELLSFEVSCEADGETKISWKTGAEISNDHFEVEASENGVDWKMIYSVKPNELHDYKYQHKALSKKYYRLVQVDVGGKRTTYMTKLADCNNASQDILLYPNPASDILDVLIQSEKDKVLEIGIYNNIGQQIERLTLSSNAIHQLDITPFPSGQYILLVENGAHTKEKKFVIVD